MIRPFDTRPAARELDRGPLNLGGINHADDTQPVPRVRGPCAPARLGACHVSRGGLARQVGNGHADALPCPYLGSRWGVRQRAPAYARVAASSAAPRRGGPAFAP